MGTLRSTRGLALAVVALGLGLASGCFLNEIDKSSANASHMGPKDAPGKDAAPAKQAGGAPDKPGAGEKPTAAIGPSWWKTARTLGSDKSDATIARCELPKGSGYMSREDCLLRGGRPQ